VSTVKSSFLFASGTLLSRITGVVRDIVVANIFGASIFMDAFIVAFRIPNLLREMLAEGALGSAFTKVFSGLWETDQQRARKLVFQTFYLFLIVSIVVCTLGILLSPTLVDLMTLKVKQSSTAQLFDQNATNLARLLFPYLGFTVLGAVAMGALHQKGRFFLSALSPVAFNFGFIFGAWPLAGWFEAWLPQSFEADFAGRAITGLAVGVLAGGMGQLTMQLVGMLHLIRGGWRHWGKSLPWSPDVKHVLTIMAPAAVAASSGPVNIYINTNFATSLGEGAVTWLNYAFRLLQLPIGLFGVAVGVAVLPNLTRSIVRAGHKVDVQASQEFQKATELVVWLMLPCLVFFLMNSREVITLLFQSGRFTENDAIATGQALFAYSFGMMGYGLIKVLTAFYYAVERTSFAMKVSLGSIAVNYLGNSLLVDKLGHVGLAATTSITLSMNCLILFMGLRGQSLAWNRAQSFRSMGFMLLSGLGALILQGLCSHGLHAVQFGGIDHPKAQAIIAIVLNGVLTLGVFGFFVSRNFRMSPREILRMVSKRGSSGKSSV